MECLNPISIRTKGSVRTTKVLGTVFLNEPKTRAVPCGKCAYCLVNRRSQWQFRIAEEMRCQVHPGWFLTMTYDERHVKRVPAGLSLRFRDVQLFCKRLRKRKYYLKYIIVGEYGSETHRPHYHAILWTDAPDTVIQEEWYLGSIHFASLTMASAMYTLKYIIQPKQRKVDGLEPTRAQFSRGIGIDYLTPAIYNWLTFDYENPRMIVTLCDSGEKVALPRYYKGKVYTKHQMRLEASKNKSRLLKEQTKHFAELRDQGITNVRPYLKLLRVEGARRIIETTKYGTSL